MGKPRDLVHPTSPKRGASVTLLFVCPGVHDQLLPYISYTAGNDCSEPRNCPFRDCCLWYAGHDLGGSTSIDDFPPGAVLPARFHTPPFSCPDFRDHEQFTPPVRREASAAAKEVRSVALSFSAPSAKACDGQSSSR